MNKRIHEYISEESISYQKKIAVKMWQYIKKWYVKHQNEYMNPLWLKNDFCYEYYKKTGQHIDWESNCMLCNIFYDDACHGCPLYKTDMMFCYEYFKLSDVDFPYDMRPSVCDRIIEAIESYEE